MYLNKYKLNNKSHFISPEIVKSAGGFSALPSGQMLFGSDLTIQQCTLLVIILSDNNYKKQTTISMTTTANPEDIY